MDEHCKYESLASITRIEDITSDESNAEILRRLDRDDPDFKSVSLSLRSGSGDFRGGKGELGWLGYYIGKSSHVRELELRACNDGDMKPFCDEVSRNRSIEKICFYGFDLRGSKIFSMLKSFIQKNSSLIKFEVDGCELGDECIRLLSLVLGGCKNKSLKHIKLCLDDLNSGSLTNIIIALTMHPQLEILELEDCRIGRNESMALATLLRWTTVKLHTLNLGYNMINSNSGAAEILAGALSNNTSLRNFCLRDNAMDDEGLDAITRALAHNRELRVLDLSYNGPITMRGLKSLAALLENENSSLEEICFLGNNVSNEGALVFAQALSKNSKLMKLGLNENHITAEGWSAFSKLLCDPSSVNRTFLSNHTLHHCAPPKNAPRRSLLRMPKDTRTYLKLNGSSMDKKHVAMVKILKYHSEFNMKPLFEWDLKALPHAIGWFERADSCTSSDYDSQIGKMKLSSLYQFIRGLPLEYIKAHTLNQLAKIRATKMSLQWQQLELASKLEEVERQESQVLRRL